MYLRRYTLRLSLPCALWCVLCFSDLYAKYNCTYCQEDIAGLRVKCIECPEFDLCLQVIHYLDAEWPYDITCHRSPPPSCLPLSRAPPHPPDHLFTSTSSFIMSPCVLGVSSRRIRVRFSCPYHHLAPFPASLSPSFPLSFLLYFHLQMCE